MGLSARCVERWNNFLVYVTSARCSNVGDSLPRREMATADMLTKPRHNNKCHISCDNTHIPTCAVIDSERNVKVWELCNRLRAVSRQRNIVPTGLRTTKLLFHSLCAIIYSCLVSRISVKS
jgi:hypothetical protein